MVLHQYEIVFKSHCSSVSEYKNLWTKKNPKCIGVVAQPSPIDSCVLLFEDFVLHFCLLNQLSKVLV